MKFSKNYIQKTRQHLNRLSSGWSLLVFSGVLGIAILLSSAFNKHMTCTDVEIEFINKGQESFVSENDIMRKLQIAQTPVQGLSTGIIDLDTLEKKLLENAFVKKADLYFSHSGKLHVLVQQRIPQLRIFNERNQSYYISEEAEKFPLSNRYTARVIPCSGSISEYLERGGAIQSDLLKSVFQVSSAIEANDFMKGLVGEIVINENHKIVLVPTIGKAHITIGNEENLEEKFKKVKYFYKKVMPRKGWNHYKSINAEFSNQIIAK